jgi:hypothetical protein
MRLIAKTGVPYFLRLITLVRFPIITTGTSFRVESGVCRWFIEPKNLFSKKKKKNKPDIGYRAVPCWDPISGFMNLIFSSMVW